VSCGAAHPGCPCCGWQVGTGDLFHGILGLPLAMPKAPRWPRRRRSYVLCPECGWEITIANEISRDLMETVV